MKNSYSDGNIILVIWMTVTDLMKQPPDSFNLEM